ncbi:MAG: sigma-70 family RNA polymerase sigma factor [Verrucomicrobiota bacterium]
MNIAMKDHELLREFVQRRSEGAFRQLVERHLRMVCSAAQRMVGDDHLAQDVTQNVFITLAQKARDIRPPQIVGGWLYNTTRHLAMHTVRGERRRREREEAAIAMQSSESHSDTDRVIEQLEPALAELDADDRDTLVLRYLEDRNLREVGAEFGISEDAARMRANRALERLRTVLDRRGVTVTSVLLGSALVSGTSSMVSAGLVSVITSTALAGTILTTTTIATMNWINAKAVSAIVGAAIIAGTGTYLVQHKEINRLQDENQKLVAQQAALTADAQAAQTAAQSNQDELERLKKEASEAVRLRGQVAQLTRQRNALKEQNEQLAAKYRMAPAPAPSAANSFTKENMAFAGYATPEAALQSVIWATMSGQSTADQIAEALSPELLNNKEEYQVFEQNRKESQQVFKSVDMLAKKALNENKLEFKVALSVDLGPNAPAQPPTVMLVPMTKVGGQWKLASNPNEYKESWDTEGQVQTYGK